LVFDSTYDEYRGVVIYVRVFGGDLKKGDKVKFVASGENTEVLDLGYFQPNWVSSTLLHNGSIGYLVTGVKNLSKAQVGDTIIKQNTDTKALAGYKEVKPMVYAGIFPAEGNEYQKLRDAIMKLKLSDASLAYEPASSQALGFGFRCGFLGLLHLEIFQERLKREFNLDLIVTIPTVAYKLYFKNGEQKILTTPSEMPDPTVIDHVDEPYVNIEIVTPKKYIGDLIAYVIEVKGQAKDTEYLDENRVILRYQIPLSSVLVDFYDKMKSISSGYASLNYDLAGYHE
jgi:GTP-binding protein LepA